MIGNINRDRIQSGVESCQVSSKECECISRIGSYFDQAVDFKLRQENGEFRQLSWYLPQATRHWVHVFDIVTVNTAPVSCQSNLPDHLFYIADISKLAKTAGEKTVQFRYGALIHRCCGFGEFIGDDTGQTVSWRKQGGCYPATANSATDHLMVVEVPMELNFNIGKTPFRPYADFAVNASGDERAMSAGRPDKKDQNKAYMAGLEIGATKKKHDWDINAWWQHVEAFALDPNLVDADIMDSRVNMEGFAVSTRYNFTDNVYGVVTYANGDRIDNTLGNGASLGDLTNINPLGNYHLLQVDLNWKF